MFTATVEGADQLASTWGRVTSTIRVGAERGAGLGAKEGAAEARARHTFKNQTGSLERSIQGRTIGWSGDTYKAEIIADAKSSTKGRAHYASFVENGRGPITAPDGAVLRFVIGGRIIFRRSVKAATALPFMHLAFYKCEAVMFREVETSIASAQAILDRS